MLTDTLGLLGVNITKRATMSTGNSNGVGHSQSKSMMNMQDANNNDRMNRIFKGGGTDGLSSTNGSASLLPSPSHADSSANGGDRDGYKEDGYEGRDSEKYTGPLGGQFNLIVSGCICM